MIVRIRNKDKDSDRFFDCVRSCVIPNTDDQGVRLKDFLLIVDFGKVNQDITFVLDKGDEIYYMNDTGKTIATDMRAKYQ